MPKDMNMNNQQSQRNNGDLSQAAQKMRSGDARERSEGASQLGQAGGRNSHKND